MMMESAPAGNSSTENDGAASVVLMSEEQVAAQKPEVLAEVISCGVGVSDPRLTYPAVPVAVDKALAKAGLTLADIDLIEIQEAFAAQALADAQLMKLGKAEMDENVNVNGSGISLDHPVLRRAP